MPHLRKTLLAAFLAVSLQSAHADELSSIKLPHGFHIEVYARVPNARQLAIGPDGTLYVGSRGGSVYAVPDQNHDMKADHVYPMLKGLNFANGVAFHDGDLYVAEIQRIHRLRNITGHWAHPPKDEIVFDKLPDKEHHGWKFIRFSPDGYLYVPVGAPDNIGIFPPPFASLLRMKGDFSGYTVYATGIRNTVGFDWDPRTRELWFTDNGRDLLGDDIPPDELNHAPHAGLNFGFPYRYGQNVPDPELGSKAPRGVEFTPAALDLQAHVAALGMRFYTGQQFPARYKNHIFIANHGSWNRTVPIGYRVLCVDVTDPKHPKQEVFAEGWLQKGQVKRLWKSGLASDLLLNGLLPYLAYEYMVDSLHWSEVKSLIWISVIPFVVAMVVLARDRRVDLVAGFSLFGIVLSLLAAVCSSDARMLLVRESYTTLVIAVIFLGSALVRRPILYMLMISQLRNDPEKLAGIQGALQDPLRARLFYGMTYLWGLSMVLEVAIKIWMIDVLSPARVLFWGPVSTYGVTGLTILATLWLARSVRKTLERRSQ